MSNEKKAEEQKACPTQSGKCTGYIVEYKTEDKVWKEIESQLVPSGYGIKRAHYPRGEYILAGVLGLDAALAHAWTYKANNDPLISIRIVPYRIHYSMEAYRQDDEIKELSPWIGMLDHNPDEPK